MDSGNQEHEEPGGRTERRNQFRDALLSNDRFIYTAELVPGRGSRGKNQNDVLRFARAAALGGLIDALSVTDNPGGHPALAPDAIGQEILRLGIDPIIHFTCKDKNRNQIESILYALDRLGIQNLLVMTGDYPLYGFQGKAKPVYDLDSVHLLRLISRMNQGLDIDEKAPGGGTGGPPIHVVKGCAVSPFKLLESETMAQYYKLIKKVREGADFIITQVGFDIRKFEELLTFMRSNGISTPILGNVYILNLPVARAMNKGIVPGCVVTDRLLRECEQESQAADKGREARLLRAAKMIAVLHGIGYNGVHIGGPNLKYEDVEWVIGRSRDFFADWKALVAQFDYPQPGGFYLWEKDPLTGLNGTRPANRPTASAGALGYHLMRILHRFAFAEDAPLYGSLCSFFRSIDRTFLERPLTRLEYGIKSVTSQCRRCGDCTLAEVAFLCPQSQCPKFLFNGQCGGSSEGWCEVFPGVRRCIFVRAYNRLVRHHEEDSLEQGYVRPRNWALDQRSSWANYFLGRDHRRKTCERE